MSYDVVCAESGCSDWHEASAVRHLPLVWCSVHSRPGACSGAASRQLGQPGQHTLALLLSAAWLMGCAAWRAVLLSKRWLHAQRAGDAICDVLCLCSRVLLCWACRAQLRVLAWRRLLWGHARCSLPAGSAKMLRLACARCHMLALCGTSSWSCACLAAAGCHGCRTLELCSTRHGRLTGAAALLGTCLRVLGAGRAD